MGRRSDHSRSELRTLILDAGIASIAEVGFAKFSAREVAKTVGYSIGTIHNVFGNVDGLVTAIKTQAFADWADALEQSLAHGGDDRIAALNAGYFPFRKEKCPPLDRDLRSSPGLRDIDPEQEATRQRLMRIVAVEVATALERPLDQAVSTFPRSLVATVHGHCSFAITRSWEAMGQTDVESIALARVRESIAAFRSADPAVT